MAIAHIIDMITLILNKERRGFVKKSQKVLAVKQAMYDYFDAQVEVYRKTRVIPACVRKFVKTAEITPLTDGSANVPTDYAQDVSGETSCGKELTILTQEEWMDRIHSEILAPEAENPIAKIENGKIFVQPDEFTAISLTYFRKPNEFVYATTTSGDGRSEEFDSGSSTDIEFSIEHSKDIVMRALKYLGVAFQNVEALQLAVNDNPQ